MSVLMEQHQRWAAARDRLWNPQRKSLRQTLAELPPAPPRKEPEPWGCPVNLLGPPGPRTIMRLVTLDEGILPRDMTSQCRTKEAVAARDRAIGLIWTHCRQMSLPALGRLFGNRDHTTILHTLRKLRLKGHHYYRRPVVPTIHDTQQDQNKTGVAQAENPSAT